MTCFIVIIIVIIIIVIIVIIIIVIIIIVFIIVINIIIINIEIIYDNTDSIIMNTNSTDLFLNVRTPQQQQQ